MESEASQLETDELYERLNILGNKCSALLQLSSVVLALNVIPAAGGGLDGLPLALSMVTALVFLATSLLSLFVIWIEWEPTERILILRTRLYKVTVVLTAIGLISMAAIIITSLV